MTDIFLTMGGLLFITFIGFIVIKLFNLWNQAGSLTIFASSFGLGAGLVSMQLYIYSRIGLTWNTLLIFIPWCLLYISFLIKNKKVFKFSILKPQKLKKVHIFLLLLIFLTVSYVFFEALIRPVSVWDAVAIWVNKSKIFFVDQRISKDSSIFLSDPGYPLIISLLGTFIYIILGHINDSVILLTSFAFYFFSSLIFFSVVKKNFGLTYALVFVLLFVTTQNFIRHGGRLEAGQADLPLGYYSFVCFLLLMDYFKKGKIKTLFLLSIFLGITGLIKSEAIFFVIAVSIIALIRIYRTRLFKHLLILIFWVFPILEWEFYKRTNIIVPSFHSAYANLFSIQRIISTIYGIFKEFVNIKSWGFLWIVYFYSFLITKIKNNTELVVLNFLILSQIVTYFLIYIFFTGYTPESSAERLYVHIAPLVIYYVALISYPIIKSSNFSRFLK